MILLLGASGYIGEAFAMELQRRNIAFRPLSRKQVNYARFDALLDFLKEMKPDFVINAAGYTGKPNVDACELARADTLAGNTLLPQTIAHACAAAGIPWGHVSSGCIFSGAKVTVNGQTRAEKDMTRPELRALVEKSPQSIHGFTETDTPNFSFRDGPCSFYSGSKALGEEAMAGIGQRYVWRLRIPFDEMDNARNYLSKVQRYPKVYDNVNSISHRGDFVRAAIDLWERRAPFGVYNMTNPGFVTTRFVVQQIEMFLNPPRLFEFWTNDEEFYRIAAKTPRSNCVLDCSKLLATGVKIRSVGEALLDSLINWRPEKMNPKSDAMNLLITGGAGFIGSNVIHHVIDRPEVVRLVNLDCLTYAGHLENLATVSRHPKYVFEKVDLRDKTAVLRVVEKHTITHVMHLAAESHVDRSITGPGDFIQTNVIGTFHLLEACRACWLAGRSTISAQPSTGFRFHHVSTDEVFGSLGATDYFTETTPYAPNSPYSASKAASDMLVRAYHHTYGLPAVVTNCSNNYGPFQFPEKLIPVVIQSVLTRQPVPVYGDGMNVRDWLYVRDHAEALWLALARGRDGETYNVGGHNEWPNLRIVELICDIIDELAPKLGGNSRKLVTFVTDRLGHDRRYAIDATKIQSELGWTPAHKFEDGIRETIQWYLDNQAWVKAVTQK